MPASAKQGHVRLHRRDHGEDHDGYDNTIYWCLETMKGYGPDDDYVNREECRNLPDRATSLSDPGIPGKTDPGTSQDVPGFFWPAERVDVCHGHHLIGESVSLKCRQDEFSRVFTFRLEFRLPWQL